MHPDGATGKSSCARARCARYRWWIAAACGVGLLLSLHPVPAGLPSPTFADVAYGSYDDPSNPLGESNEKLDLYLQAGYRDLALPQPVLVEIHGGGLQVGKKSDDLDYFGTLEQAFDELGVALVSINHPLVQHTDYPPNLTPNLFPVPHEAVQRALQFLRAKASDWNLDPERVYLIGQSAGGNLSAWVAMSADARDPAAAPGSPASQSSRATGIVPFIAPTMFTPYHQTTTAARPSLWNMFGAANQQEYLQVPIATTYAASAGWLAQYGGPGLAPAASAAVSAQNREVPILCVYAEEDPGKTCSTQYPLPTSNPHSKVFGLLFAEAFGTDYGLPPYGSPPLVTCPPTTGGPPGWKDFSFYLHPNGELTPADEAAVADFVVAWLRARIERPIAVLSPEPGPVAAAFVAQWHVNLGSCAAVDFVADLAADPADNELFLALLVGGNPVLITSYLGLLTGPLAPFFTATASKNTIDVRLDVPLDLQAFGLSDLTTALLVQRAGQTVLATSTYTAAP